MDYNKAALEMHESHHGKVGIVSKVEVKTRDDLSTAYTPGVAEPCRKIKDPNYAMRINLEPGKYRFATFAFQKKYL